MHTLPKQASTSRYLWLFLFFGFLTAQPTFSFPGWISDVDQSMLSVNGISLLPSDMLGNWVAVNSSLPERVPTDEGNRAGEMVIVEPKASNTLTPMLEGESQTFTVALSEVPTGGNVVVIFSSETTGLSFAPESPLTFTTTNFNVPQTITVTAIDNQVTDENRMFFVNFSATGGGYSDTKKITIYVNNDDEGNVLIDPASIDPVNEGSPVTFTVKLSLEPASDVTVNLTPAAGLDIVPLGPLTFTKTTWNDPQTITVTARQNTVADRESEWLRINMVSSGGGYTDKKFIDLRVYGDQVGEPAKRELVVAAPRASEPQTPMTEGDSQTFTVALSSEPTGEVTVSLTSEAGLTVDQTNLTFTPENYDTPQTVTVTASDNQVVLGRQVLLHVRLSSSGGEYTDTHEIKIFVNENDSGKIMIDPASVNPVYEGESFNFTVSLNLEPASDVIVTLTTSTGLKIDPQGPLTFTPTNYNIPKTIAVSVTGEVTGKWLQIHVITEQPGWVQGAVSVYVSEGKKDERDIRGEVTIVGPSASNNNTPVTEGGAQTFTVALPTEPTGDVIATFTPDAGITLNQTELTFTQTNYSIPQEINFTVTDNLVTDGHRALRIKMSLSGGGYSITGSILVYVDENDRGELLVNPKSLGQLAEGASTKFTVALKVEPSDNVTVSIEENTEGPVVHPLIALNLDPSTLTFTPENWQTPQEVLVTVVDNSTVDDNDWQRIRLTSSGGGYDRVGSTIDVYLLNNDMSVAVEAESLPQTFTVIGNYPNPFTNTTRLTFDLPWRAHIRIEVLDVIGRQMLSMSENEMDAGWSKTIELNNPSLPAGFYLYRLIADSSTGISMQTGRFVVIH